MEKKRHNLRYMLKEWMGMSKSSFILSLARIPTELLLPTLMAIIPKLIIDAIGNKVSDSYMLVLIGIATIVLVLLSVIQPYLYGKLNKATF